MEQQKAKFKRGRPRFYTDEERKQRKTDYMLHKEWFCDLCNTGRNYHLHTKKHFINALKYNLEEKIEIIESE